MIKREKEQIYQEQLAKCYENMDMLVKRGQMISGWQKNKQAIITLKKTARLMTKNKIKKMGAGHGDNSSGKE